MDTEQNLQKQIDSNDKAIKDAKHLMDEMAALRKKLNIQQGCGQRYLQKLKPEQGLLKKAEKEIMSQYAGGSGSTSKKNDKKSSFLRDMSKRNTI